VARPEQERQRWNQAFTDPAWRSTRFNEQPNDLLVRTCHTLPPGRALDVGMGEGRNALYLAGLGWQVTGIDVADAAQALAQQRATAAGLALTTITHDISTYDWGQAQWNLVVLSYIGGRELTAKAIAALRPGGRLVLECFHAEAAPARGGQQGVDVGFETEELKKDYEAAGFAILHYAEPLGVADFSRETHRLVQLVAQKPGAPG